MYHVQLLRAVLVGPRVPVIATGLLLSCLRVCVRLCVFIFRLFILPLAVAMYDSCNDLHGVAKSEGASAMLGGQAATPSAMISTRVSCNNATR